MKLLLVGDLHLTSQPRDSYRWRIFEVLKRELRKLHVDELVLLGDITDQKDNHAAVLVNRVCEELCNLRESVRGGIHVLRGNHDGIDPQWPYFHFLGRFPRIHFYATPQPMVCDGKPLFFMLPHSRDPLREWAKTEWERYPTVFAHVTVKGAVSESGTKLDSVVGADYFRKRNVAVFAGDVHVPQRIRPITYVGAPYPIRFGDSFAPRIICLGEEGCRSIELKPLLHRRLLDLQDAAHLAGQEGLEAGDQVKVRLHLTEDRLHTWPRQRKQLVAYCRNEGIDLVDVRVIKEDSGAARPVPQRIQTKRPMDTLHEYIAQRRVAERLAAVGRALVEER